VNSEGSNANNWDHRNTPGEPSQVLFRWNVSMDDVAWRALGRRQFENAYTADDSVYEFLIHDTPARLCRRSSENVVF
jgi:hypothetical protein